MKNVSNDYKNAIKTNGKQIDTIITYNSLPIDNSKIRYVKYSSKSGILKTLMQEIDLDTSEDIDIGDTLNFQFGVLVNGNYEYINYGDFIVNKKEYKEDAKTYRYKLYDKMLLAMVSFVDNNTYPCTLYDFTNNIIQALGFTLGNNTLPNGTRTLNSNPFEGYDGITYRNVLDNICEVVGKSAKVIGLDIVFISPNDTNYTLTSGYLDETNVKFGETFGPINSVLFTRFEDSDYVEIKDDSSIAQYGKTQINIKNNPILNNDDRIDYQQEMFDEIKGLSYNLCDYQSKGITFLEYYDLYDVVRDSNTYHCLMLNDEFTITTGLKENIYTEEPQEYESEYKTQDTNVDDVSAKVDKANKEIVLKVDSQGKLVQAQLKADPSTGSVFNVKADNIKLEGYTTINGTFTIDNNGNMSCSNATITGGNVIIPSGYGITQSITPQGVRIYKSNDASVGYIYLSTQQEGQLHYGVLELYYEGGSPGITMYGSGTIECDYISARKSIKTGTITLYGNQNTYQSFGTTMLGTPIVVLSPVHDGDTIAYVGNIVAVDQWGFQAYRSGGGSTGITFNWIAIYM